MTPPNDFKQQPVLIADDDEFFRVGISSVLTNHSGFKTVIQCDSLDSAVERLNETDGIAFGLFDLNMVNMNNWVDLQALREQYPDMRLMVVSASKRCEDILMALSIGAHGYVHKGMGVGELGRAIDIVSGGDVYVPPFLPDAAAEQGLMSFVPEASAEGAAAQSAGKEPADHGAPPSSSDVGTASLHCTPRQREIIELLIKGFSNKGMARELDLSEGTIKFHMSAVLRLMGTNSRVAAATRAMEIFKGEAKPSPD